MNDIILKKATGETYTTSLLIAEKFGKRHDTVLRKIQQLPDGDFNRRNFAVVNYTDSKGENRKMYEITRDGFSLLAMGFTGDKAYKWKVKFIEAFNKMERHLRNMLKKEWFEHKAEAALEYRQMSRTLQEVRKLEGKTTQNFHYINEAKLVNWTLTGKFQKVDRSRLTEKELGVLVALESYNAVLLAVGHDRNTRKVLLKTRHQELMQLAIEAA